MSKNFVNNTTESHVSATQIVSFFQNLNKCNNILILCAQSVPVNPSLHLQTGLPSTTSQLPCFLHESEHVAVKSGFCSDGSGCVAVYLGKC